MLSNFLFSKPKNVGNAKCRPTIDRVSTNYWPIHRSSIGQLSTNYRRSMGEVSAKCRRSVGERKAISAETHLERLSAVSRPSVDPLSTNYRPTIALVSTDYRPLYRPIDRSTLPTVNMIRGFLSWFERCSFSVLLRHLFAILGEFYKVVV